MGMETLGNTGIVAGGMGAGVQPMIDIGGCHHGGYDNDGFGGGQGIWAILLLALLGRRGFGGEGDCVGTGGNCIVPNLLNDNNNKNFQSLQDSINNQGILNYLNTSFQGQLEATRDADKAICKLDSDVQNGFGQTRLDACNGFGLTNQNIAEAKYQNVLELQRATAITNSNIAENKFQSALETAAIRAQLAECCCDLKTQGMENTQRILDKMSCNEIQALRDRLEDTRLQLSQCGQNATLINALRPTPIPAYPVWNGAPIFTPTVSAQSFCGAPGTSFGQGGCGGCGIL